jgi:hypothetical protein
VLLLASPTPALAHSGEVHGSSSGGGDGVPHLTLLALAVAGGLLLGPALTRREGSPIRRRRALQLLAALAVAGVLLADLTPTRLTVGLLLTAVLALPMTPASSKGAVLLVLPSLLLRDVALEAHVVVMVGHVVGAGLWAGTVVHLLTLRDLDRSAWRAGTRPAVAGIAISSLSGVLSAGQVGLRPGNLTDSGYGLAVLGKASVVAVLVLAVALLSRRTHRERLLRAESFALLGILATGVLLAVATPPVRDLLTPPGLSVEGSHTLLLAADGDRRLLRVTPAADVTLDGRPLAGTRALDGSVAVALPTSGRVRVDGDVVTLPDAVPLAAGPGDESERLARTLGRLMGERADLALPSATAALAGQRESLAKRRLTHPVVIVDGDSRGLEVARFLGARTVAATAPALPADADVAYVATSWSSARNALRLASSRRLLGGSVLLPWLITPQALDAARGDTVTLLSDLDLEGPSVFGYRRALAQLPGERPTSVGLRAWNGSADEGLALTYAPTPAGIFPAELSHGHVDAAALPAWTSGGSLVGTSRRTTRLRR